jgi:hypothetical protein
MFSRYTSPLNFFIVSILSALMIFAGCAGSNKSDPEPQVPQEVLALTAKYDLTMMQCPDRIWYNYNWADLKVIFVYPDSDWSWAWDASADEIERISTKKLAKLDKGTINKSFHFFEWDEQAAMSLIVEEGDDKFAWLFYFGVHEFFHNQGQKGWKGQHGRMTAYPFEWEPRLYRRMMFDNLKRFLEHEHPVDLGRARYWYDRWAQDAYEVGETTDGYEGTAKYVDRLAEVVWELGCSATDDQLRTRTYEKINAEFGHPTSGKILNLASEGYEIGALAAFILRFSGQPLASWNARMALGDTPVEVLLEDVTPVPEEAPVQLLEMFKQTADRLNEELTLVDQAISRWGDQAFVRLVTDWDFIESNLSPSMFLYSKDLELELFPLGLDHPCSSPEHRSEYRLKKDAVLLLDLTPACAQPAGFVTLVPQDSLHLINGTADISTPTVEGRITGELKADPDGFLYFCVE